MAGLPRSRANVQVEIHLSPASSAPLNDRVRGLFETERSAELEGILMEVFFALGTVVGIGLLILYLWRRTKEVRP